MEDPDYRFRMMKLGCAKVDSAGNVIDSTLEKYVKAFPSFNQLPPFYIALIDTLHPIGDIRRMLGRLDGARKQVQHIQVATVRQIKRTTKTEYMEKKRREAFGRFSSIVNELGPDLLLLADLRGRLKQVPSIPTKYPTIVVAGYPSVGKSQLVRSISTADPKVAPYPFTTHELTVGVFTEGRKRYQVIDTPGLLDRPFEERNPIEKQGVIALTLLSKVCIYMFDPTGHCGFPLEPQLSLLASIRKAVPELSFIIVVNKSDLSLPEGVDPLAIDREVEKLGKRCIGRLSVSSTDGTGLSELKALIVSSNVVEEKAPWEEDVAPG